LNNPLILLKGSFGSENQDTGFQKSENEQLAHSIRAMGHDCPSDSNIRKRPWQFIEEEQEDQYSNEAKTSKQQDEREERARKRQEVNSSTVTTQSSGKTEHEAAQSKDKQAHRASTKEFVTKAQVIDWLNNPKVFPDTD